MTQIADVAANVAIVSVDSPAASVFFQVLVNSGVSALIGEFIEDAALLVGLPREEHRSGV